MYIIHFKSLNHKKKTIEWFVYFEKILFNFTGRIRFIHLFIYIFIRFIHQLILPY
jgi:hypothetical protein